MRYLRLLLPAVLLTAWLGGIAAQQGQPPPSTPPPAAPPTGSPPTGAPPAAPPAEERAAPSAPAEDVEEVFIPTEELQPDAAITFPVDI